MHQVLCYGVVRGKVKSSIQAKLLSLIFLWGGERRGKIVNSSQIVLTVVFIGWWEKGENRQFRPSVVLWEVGVGVKSSIQANMKSLFFSYFTDLNALTWHHRIIPSLASRSFLLLLHSPLTKIDGWYDLPIFTKKPKRKSSDRTAAIH